MSINLKKYKKLLIIKLENIKLYSKINFEYSFFYETLLKKSETSSIVKTRYEIPIYGGLIAELDIYHGDLENLQTVEVEFDTLEQADSFIPPEWFADEISSDIRYSNAYLALYGLPNPKFL